MWRHMRIRAPKDFWAGLIFIAIAGSFILLAQQYRLGDLHRMGPAMFPTLVGALSTWSAWGGLQLGLSWLVWGVFVRTVAVWHITWSVNSVTHIWGYRSFDTHDDSRNNWLVGLVSNGEGWSSRVPMPRATCARSRISRSRR